LPVRTLSDALSQRPENDLTPINSEGAPRELWPLINATNQVMARLAHLLEHQRRFVRDTSHQLRTPLAVLKVQVQSALRGDQAPEVALNEIEHTVDRATRMANQMLALAKVEQLREQAQASATSLNAAVREVALDVAPLIAEKGIDFDIDTDPTWVRAHEWMLSELTRNLLHNAVKHTPRGGRLSVKVQVDASSQGLLRVSNDGPPISDTQRERLFQPFAAMGGQMGAGLGLAICRSIVDALDGRIDVRNREAEDGSPGGVDVLVWLPLSPIRP
jgi:two-component system sensor histidine kinase TctE